MSPSGLSLSSPAILRAPSNFTLFGSIPRPYIISWSLFAAMARTSVFPTIEGTCQKADTSPNFEFVNKLLLGTSYVPGTGSDSGELASNSTH